jgi:cytochrome c oxidase subunit 3
MLLFIFREFMFFFCIFWVFFDSSLVLIVDTGDSWSSLGYCFINPLGVPMLNSFILLRRAATVTWSHFRLLGNYSCLFRLVCTLLLSFYFLSIQFMEYTDSEFSIRRGVYGSIFFFSTGFHGLHVIFGRIFLLVNYFRIVQNHYRIFRHLGYEFSILYWHFVDVVWLFLFVFVYWWSY